MIISFNDDATEDLFHGKQTKRLRQFPPEIIKSAQRKLDALNAAHTLQDLENTPGNRLDKKKGVLKGYYGIRINNAWRIIFKWENGNAFSVKVTDYH